MNRDIQVGPHSCRVPSDIAREGALPRRRRILTFLAHYLPGYKAGGILRTVVNTVDWLGDDFEFFVVTQDRDLGDRTPYLGVTTECWTRVGKAWVHYIPPKRCTMRTIATLIASTPHDVIHLNSFFDPVFTLRVLIARRVRMARGAPVILSPRGEFSDACLGVKRLKKSIFIGATRALGLHRDIAWHASSEIESRDYCRVMNIESRGIHIAMDLPMRADARAASTSESSESRAGELRVVFLSRIARTKNLDYSLRVLAKVRARIEFDVFGPTEDLNYWEECKRLADALPPNVKFSYRGAVQPDQTLEVFSKYDLFFFPTKSENYGHVIAESLAAGTPVLLSDATPWLNLDADGLGWVRSLGRPEEFTAVIEEVASAPIVERQRRRAAILHQRANGLLVLGALEANRRLFTDGISPCLAGAAGGGIQREVT